MNPVDKVFFTLEGALFLFGVACIVREIFSKP